MDNPYKDFVERLKVLATKHPTLVLTTLSNIFTMRSIGNKTHGDLAEIAISEFINQYMYDFSSVHVGKDLYRAKSKEEDIRVMNEITRREFPVSLKTYGDGPLQLSTDKSFLMFPRLEMEHMPATDEKRIRRIFTDPAFANFEQTNVLPLIYDEKKGRCNILVFNHARAKDKAASILREDSGRGRKHPVYRFYDRSGGYIFEVRYGGATANALQRGLWTHTKKGSEFFDSLTNGWVEYSNNQVLVKLLSRSLVSSESGHRDALDKIKEDISALRRNERL